MSASVVATVVMEHCPCGTMVFFDGPEDRSREHHERVCDQYRRLREEERARRAAHEAWLWQEMGVTLGEWLRHLAAGAFVMLKPIQRPSPGSKPPSGTTTPPKVRTTGSVDAGGLPEDVE